MSKWEDFKNGVRTVTYKIWTEACEHPFITMALIGFAGTAIESTSRIISSNAKNKISERNKLQVYDPQTGEYLRLRRQLNTNEQVELAIRRQDGENVTIILSDMGVLR